MFLLTAELFFREREISSLDPLTFLRNIAAVIFFLKKQEVKAKEKIRN